MIELDEAALVEGLAEVFAEQLAAWRAAGRPGVPLLALADALPPTWGRCLSCGCPVEAWRCVECLAAVRLALQQVDAEAVSFTPRAPVTHPMIREVEDAVAERDLWRHDG